MNDWQKATMDNLYYNPEEEPETGDECLVRIENGFITLKYDYYDGLVIWRGTEMSPGHFELRCAEKGGKGTLHRFPGSNLLVGEWREAGERGMWRIEVQ